MKLLNRRILRYLTLIAIGIVTYSNCSSSHEVIVLGSAAPPALPHDHPNIELLQQNVEIEKKPLLMNRTQIVSHLKAIFYDEDLSQSAKSYANTVLDVEALSRGNSFGGACDYADPLDANVPEGDCLREGSSPTLDVNVSPSIHRQGHHQQLCLRLLASDEILTNFRWRVQAEIGENSADLTTRSLQSIYQYFFIGQTMSEKALQEFLRLDEEMRRSSETINDRWRLVTMIVCESPDWARL